VKDVVSKCLRENSVREARLGKIAATLEQYFALCQNNEAGVPCWIKQTKMEE